MKLFAGIAAAVVLSVAAPMIYVQLGDGAPPAQEHGLPWQIDTDASGGSRVFGLDLGQDTLAAARTRFDPRAEVAIVAPPGAAPRIEAYFDNVRAGFITGKLVVSAAADESMVRAMIERAIKTEYMESVTRKHSLHPDDLEQALRLRLATLAFLPTARLDEDIALQRFGPPAERVRINDRLEHLLYPALGLDLALDARGKDVLQYVAPRDFERLAAPLRAAVHPSAEASAEAAVESDAK